MCALCCYLFSSLGRFRSRSADAGLDLSLSLWEEEEDLEAEAEVEVEDAEEPAEVPFTLYLRVEAPKRITGQRKHHIQHIVAQHTLTRDSGRTTHEC